MVGTQCAGHPVDQQVAAQFGAVRVFRQLLAVRAGGVRGIGTEGVGNAHSSEIARHDFLHLVSKLARLVQYAKPLMTLLYLNGRDHVAICFVFTSIFFPGENLLQNFPWRGMMAPRHDHEDIDETSRRDRQ
jgi:hypothetical protein